MKEVAVMLRPATCDWAPQRKLAAALLVAFEICRVFAGEPATNLTELDSKLFRPVPQAFQYEGTLFSLLESAEKGNAPAQDTLASFYFYGTGVTQDFGKGVQWFTKSAIQGFPPAQYSLGICYKTGLGVSSNRITADEWFQKAAAQDYAPAMHEAALTTDRKGNRAEALKLLRDAADRGFPSSEYLMGCVASNKVESYAWHSLAAADDPGLECAADRAAGLRSELGKEQIFQAEELRKRILERRQQLRKEQAAKAEELLRRWAASATNSAK